MPTAPLFKIVPERKLAYLVMKKCGCTSVIAALKKLEGHNGQLTPTEIHQRDDLITKKRFQDQVSNPDDWYLFTFVRDPIRRFLSFYADKIIGVQVKSNYIVQHEHLFGYFANMSLDAAIDVTTSGKFEVESHVEPQSTVIDSQRFDLNFIGRFEQFADSLARVEQEAGVQLPLLHMNKNKNPQIRINRDQFDRLRDYYLEDLTRFGYPTDYETWCAANMHTGNGEEREQAGFEFRDEATLIDHEIRRTFYRFEIDLKWKVNPKHSRRRCIAIMDLSKDPHTDVYYLPPAMSLHESSDSDGIACEQLLLPHHFLPDTASPACLYLAIYFWDAQKKATGLANLPGVKRLRIRLPVEDTSNARRLCVD